MKKVLLIFNLILFTFIAWSCQDEPPLGPEKPAEVDDLSKNVPVGSVTPILSLSPGNSPEGITVDRHGRMYISNTRNDGKVNEILRFTDNGNWEVHATLPGRGQATGLTTDSRGQVYSAFATDDPNTNGVYVIKLNRQVKRLNGSENLKTPNSLTFDLLGNLYATDSDGGSVWKYGRNRYFTKWFEDPLLKGGIVPGGPPFPLPGANGIAFYPPNKLYVANTSQNSVSCIKINYRGDGASISQVAKHDFLLMNIDGIAVGIYENVYGVLVPSTLGPILPAGIPPVPPLVKLNPKTGVVTPIVTDNTLFDTPTSLAFGRGWCNWGSVYISNANLQYGQPAVAGPGVVKVKVGIIGI